ncbi:MAG: O-antigen ligase family protein [Clostridia bacterium]|nr:O-antigen ligase family protein [Clostridia bacterium]
MSRLETGSKYIKSRGFFSSGVSSDAKGSYGMKYIKSDKKTKPSDAENSYVKKRKESSGSGAQSKYVKPKQSAAVNIKSRFVVEKTSAQDWLERITILSIYLYIGSIYVLSYSAYNGISRALFMATLFLTVIKTVMNRNTISIDLPNVFMALFIAYALLSSFWVVSQSGVDERVSTLFNLVLLYLVIRLNISSMKDLRVVLNAIIVGTIIMCLYTVYYYGVGYIISQISVGGRIGQEINQVNGMGMYCAILIAIMFYMVLYEKKWLYLAFAPLALFVLLGTGSRKGFMLAFVGVFVILFFKSGSKKLLVIFGAIMTLGIFVYLIYEFAESNYFFYRLSQALALIDSNEVTEGSISVRNEMISFGMDLFKQNPIKGYGLMQYEYLYGLTYGAPRPAHNTYIQVLVSFGIIGFVLYYGMYFYFIKNTLIFLKKNIRYVVLIASIIVVMLFNDIGANMINHKYGYIFMGLLASYVSVAKSLDDRGLTDDPAEV